MRNKMNMEVRYKQYPHDYYITKNFERYQDVTHRLINFIEAERFRWLEKWSIGDILHPATYWGKKKK